MSPDATQLELAVEATIACLGAWIYPSDPDIREVAQLACANAGVDYVASLARFVEAADAEHYSPANADRARYEAARAAFTAADMLRSQIPIRHGILATGESVDDEEGPISYG